MSYIQRHRLTATTTTTSTATVYTPNVTGKLHSINYLIGTTPYTSVMTLTVTVEPTSQVILNTTAFATTTTGGVAIAPRLAIHNTAGTTIAGDEKIAIDNARVKLLIDSAGASKDGVFDILIE